jgi:hypothetical protein
MSVSRLTFSSDPHGSKYLKVLDANAEARERFVCLLNDPCNEHRLLDAEALGHPALSGIVRFLDADPDIGPVVATDLRFRQAVGVGVRLKMEELGWVKTGVKGPVASANFSRAERYLDRSARDAADGVAPTPLGQARQDQP